MFPSTIEPSEQLTLKMNEPGNEPVALAYATFLTQMYRMLARSRSASDSRPRP